MQDNLHALVTAGQNTRGQVLSALAKILQNSLPYGYVTSVVALTGCKNHYLLPVSGFLFQIMIRRRRLHILATLGGQLLLTSE